MKKKKFIQKVFCEKAHECNRHIIGNCFASESERNTCPQIKDKSVKKDTRYLEDKYGNRIIRGKHVFDKDIWN